MYSYSEFDAAFVAERNRQFRAQVERRIAGNLIGRERADHTLQATALLNEAYVRLVEPGASFNDRSHFLRVAARAMRNVLVDHARARRAK